MEYGILGRHLETHLVIVGERIESGFKSRRIQDASSNQISGSESLRNFQKEKEDETDSI